MDVAQSAFLMKTWFWVQKQELLEWYLEPNSRAEIKICYDIVEAAQAAADTSIRAKRFDFIYGDPGVFYSRNNERDNTGVFWKGKSDLQMGRVMSKQFIEADKSSPECE